MNSIPVDLTVIEIFFRLPIESIARCRCVSKLWASILYRPDFTELFLSRSSTRPRLLFAIEKYEKCKWNFFSLPQPQNPYEKSSSLVIAADFHTKFPRDNNMWIRRNLSCGYASGLIYFPGMWVTGEYNGAVPVICNPNTKQYVILPKLIGYRKSYSFLGFDPIDKQFKVVFMAYPFCSVGGGYRILTLGTGEKKWRKIKCLLPHAPWSEGICINGVLYYLAGEMVETPCHRIVCFDVRSEKFKFINTEWFPDWSTELINYKGKLCVIYWKHDGADAIELHMWVLEDTEKQEWSKYVYTLLDNKLVDSRNVLSVVGVTATTGEIVLSMRSYSSNPFYVFYFSPERNTLQSVEIQGFEANDEEAVMNSDRVYTFVNHVEDLDVNDAKLFKSSTSALYVMNKRSLDISKTKTQREKEVSN